MTKSPKLIEIVLRGETPLLMHHEGPEVVASLLATGRWALAGSSAVPLSPEPEVEEQPRKTVFCEDCNSDHEVEPLPTREEQDAANVLATDLARSRIRRDSRGKTIITCAEINMVLICARAGSPVSKAIVWEGDSFQLETPADTGVDGEGWQVDVALGRHAGSGNPEAIVRPKFQVWILRVRFRFDHLVGHTLEGITTHFRVAGEAAGLGVWSPRYRGTHGKFKVASIKAIED